MSLRDRAPSVKSRPTALPRVEIYDATVPALAEMPGVALSVTDNCAIAAKIAELGVDYIELGSAVSQRRLISHVLSHSVPAVRFVACSPVRRQSTAAGRDPNLRALVRCGVSVGCVAAPAWNARVSKVQRTTLSENVAMVSSSVRYLKSHLEEVIFRAEHFFDGWLANPSYALEVLRAAREAGADVVVLQDTNGGQLPNVVRNATAHVVDEVGGRVGVCLFNDCDVAVASTIDALWKGACHSQCSVNGYGPRCGMANIASVVAGLSLKGAREAIKPERLRRVSEVSHFVAATANKQIEPTTPFLGSDAFSSRAGQAGSAAHGGRSAAVRSGVLFEHVDPATVGNKRHLMLAEKTDDATIIVKAAELGVDLSGAKSISGVVQHLNSLEADGYQFDAADASFALALRDSVGSTKPPFQIRQFSVSSSSLEDGSSSCEATVIVESPVSVEQDVVSIAGGSGPVNALDNALRAALDGTFPEVAKMSVKDYKAQLVDSRRVGSASLVRVNLRMSDSRRQWATVGVSTDVVAASWQALVDAYVYGLTYMRPDK